MVACCNIMGSALANSTRHIDRRSDEDIIIYDINKKKVVNFIKM